MTYDDICLVPQYSEIESRHDIDLSIDFCSMTLPIFSAPMDTVSGEDLCITLAKNGAMGIHHRYCTIEEQVKAKPFAAAIGSKGDDLLTRAHALYHEAGTRVFCIDIAHGHSIHTQSAIAWLRTKFGDSIKIIAGNVATREGVIACKNWGADAVRIGIGGGHVCSTRLVTGHGVPNGRALDECKDVKGILKIADGGIRNSGDAVKALALGADAVMMGRVFAGTSDAISRDLYRGMASKEAQEDWRGSVSVVEGVSVYIEPGDRTDAVLKRFADGMRSGLSYTGASNIKEFKEKVIWMKQTMASSIEAKHL